MRGDLLNLRSVAVCDRLLSDMELVGPKDGGDDAALDAASIVLARIRRVISIICGEHAAGRVLIGSTLRVRRAMQTAWLPPPNADFMHYGAVRGRDFAKDHAAAISIGRPELPPSAISGLAAALGYDDDDPGESLIYDRDRVRTTERRILHMRDGRDIVIDVPVMAGRWEALVQKESREDELEQFAGRLRPVFRGGVPPVWYAMTQTLPPAVIWDELIASTDITMRDYDVSTLPRNLFEIARRGGGLLSPELALEECPDLCTVEVMARTFRVDGIDLRTGTEAEHIRDQWTKLEWLDGIGNRHLAWASPWLEDPADKLKSALRGIRYDVQNVSTLRSLQPVGVRETGDHVDEFVGSFARRRKEEAAWREEYRRGMQPDDTSGMMTVGEIGLERKVRRHGVEFCQHLEASLAKQSIRHANTSMMNRSSDKAN